nr:MAG TPA: hypothetical protein [Caudoviricetes sp.]
MLLSVSQMPIFRHFLSCTQVAIGSKLVAS